MNKELEEEKIQEMINIIHSASGMNIGTQLKDYLDNEVNKILPNGFIYDCSFNMSGQVFHRVLYDNKLVYDF